MWFIITLVSIAAVIGWEHAAAPVHKPSYFIHSAVDSIVKPFWTWVGVWAAKIGYLFDHIYLHASAILDSAWRLVNSVLHLLLAPFYAVRAYWKEMAKLTWSGSVLFTWLFWTAVQFAIGFATFLWWKQMNYIDVSDQTLMQAILWLLAIRIGTGLLFSGLGLCSKVKSIKPSDRKKTSTTVPRRSASQDIPSLDMDGTFYKYENNDDEEEY